MTILFDGLDLGGKTTVARAVAMELGATYNSGGIHEDPLSRFGRRLFATNTPNIVKGAIFSGSFLVDAACARGVDGIVQDRYWPSLMAYARASYPKPIAAIITAPNRRYLRFDVNIHVTCTAEERSIRMVARGDRDRVDRSLMRDPAFAQRYESELAAIMSRLDNYLLLDTTGRTTDESVAIAMAHIEHSRTM